MLEIRQVSKQFPSVRALEGVSFELIPGEVHGIVGENGAGKSTLMKIIAGIYQPSSGEILIEGHTVRFRGVRDGINAGIAMIHQELNLVDELSVAENIFLGREQMRGPFVDKATMEREADEYLKQVAAPFPAAKLVSELSVAGKQLVEIAKALSYNAKLLIMDEPTAVLSDRETSALFVLIARLKEQGVTTLYISHILREMILVCDRITVMRDGQVVTTLNNAEASESVLANLMVGRELQDFYPAKSPAPTGEFALEVRGLSVPNWVSDFSVGLRPGELVGLAGLVGSGRTEAAESIAGLRARDSGEIFRDGTSVSIRNPRDAQRHGIAYVSEDRKSRGLHMSLSTMKNTTMANVGKYSHGPFLSAVDERKATDQWIDRLGIRANDPSQEIRYLSGGNQQKVSIAKWLDGVPKVLILDEPTRGVDVGAKREIYDLIQTLSQDGLACLVISSEMPELIGLCHRILVLREGKLMGQLEGDAMTEENIMRMAAGVAA